MRNWLVGLLLCWSQTVSAAVCEGENLFEALPGDIRAQIATASADVPYNSGILWRATKGAAQIIFAGTYHFPDPRHQQTLDKLAGPLKEAAALHVEAGPKEEARLTQALTQEPGLMVSADGPTLPERLTAAEWQALSAAMAERGMPAVVTSRLRPWYVAMMMGVSPCILKQANDAGGLRGLDHLLISAAEEENLPVHALEPWDTIFSLFADMTPGQEVDMIRSVLPAAKYADDYAVTLTDAYFAGDIWSIWEFGRFDAYENSGLGRAKIDEIFAFAQERLMNRRNESWIAPLTHAARKAAEDDKGIVAAFGALHLPGEHGVLRLLEKQGWTIEPLE